VDSKIPADPIQGWIAYLKQEQETFEVTERLLTSLAEVEQKEAKKISIYEDEDKAYEKDIDNTEQLYLISLKRLEGVGVSGKLGGYEVRVLSPPGSAGVKQVEPSLLIALGAGFLLALLGGVSLPFVAELLSTRFRSPEEVSYRLGLPVVSHIPFLTRRWAPKRRKGQPSLHPSLAACYCPAAAEAYRRVQTMLASSNGSHPRQVIQLTSASTGEGTTTVAANLAILAAQAGRRVVLLDLNFHRPRLHDLFGLSAKVGLTSILEEGGATPDEVLQPTMVEGLDILPCGPVTRSPWELLNSAQFCELIHFLRKHYDLVLLDTPALLAVTDPCAVAANADGILLALGVPRTTRAQAERARELLRTITTPVLGVVVNQVRRGGNYRGHRYAPYGTNGTAWHHTQPQGQTNPVTDTGGLRTNGRR
jgi:capsular exopolysaccharide synthesis family protein